MSVCHGKSGRAQRPGASEVDLAGVILGVSPAITSLRREIVELGQARVRSVLVTGETGVGKELVPAALLVCSPHLKGRLEVFNCPAVPADHLESELFGTTRGAYPGAIERPGAVERAAGGLLVLDEIASMPLAHQAKLLRLLESGEGRRLGGTSRYRLEVAFAAATHVDLDRAIESGAFREDLYYRLVQDAVLRVAPLRERLEDVPVLARHFLAAFPGPPVATPPAIERLQSHAWPGNVRELRAVLRAAVRIGGGRDLGVAAVDTALCRIGRSGSTGRVADGFHRATAQLRRQLLVDALAAAGGNRTRAGILLGFHRRAGAADDPSAPGSAARKLAHRKFDYWYRRLVASPDSAAGRY